MKPATKAAIAVSTANIEIETTEKPIETGVESAKINETLQAKIPISKRSGSALSLKSIAQKKALSQKKKTVVSDPENLSADPFTQEDLLKHWNEYGKRMDKKGERIVGSMFAMNKPKLLDNFEVQLELANETMRVDVENISKALIKYLQENLNNFSISLKIDVNETAAVKHAFTPQEKYEKLKQQNPLIDLLRSKLDLDL